MNVRSQRAERTALRYPFLSANFEDQFDEVQDFRVLDPACDLAQKYVVSNMIEVLAAMNR